MTSKRTSIHRNLVIDGERFAVVVETETSSARAMTAIHAQSFAHRIGGVRISKRGSRHEVGHLAAAMTYKCGASLLPFDGEKSLICCPAGPPAATAEKAELIAEHMRDLLEVDPGVTLGPDMAAGEDVMDALGSLAEFRDHITGRSEACRGLGVDKNGATAEGLVQVLEHILAEEHGLRRVTIQGFGAVGAGVAERLAKLGLEVVAVANRLGTLESTQPGGLDVAALLHCRAETGGQQDDLELERYAETERGCRFQQDRCRIMAVPTDIFVPAARTMVLAEGDELEAGSMENPEVRSVRWFHEATGARLILEGGNHPLSEKAEEYLESRGVRILVDYLVNMGGLVSCFFEWLYLPELLTDSSSVKRVNALAIEWTKLVGARNASALMESNASARTVAHRLATGSIAKMSEYFRGRPEGCSSREALKSFLDAVKTSGA